MRSSVRPDWSFYFITFRTYGTWLHGDQRGSVDRDHNVVGTPRLDTNRHLERWEREQLRTEPLILSPDQRWECDQAIQALVREKGWELLALNVRTNHVHAVLAAMETGDRVMNAMKTAATRRLRQAQLVAVEAKVWARHGSVRNLPRAEAVRHASRYTALEQGSEGYLIREC